MTEVRTQVFSWGQVRLLEGTSRGCGDDHVYRTPTASLVMRMLATTQLRHLLRLLKTRKSHKCALGMNIQLFLTVSVKWVCLTCANCVAAGDGGVLTIGYNDSGQCGVGNNRKPQFPTLILLQSQLLCRTSQFLHALRTGNAQAHFSCLQRERLRTSYLFDR